MEAISDNNVQDGINNVIEYESDDLISIEIQYHKICLLKYVHNDQKMSDDDKFQCKHNVNFCETLNIFFSTNDITGVG